MKNKFKNIVSVFMIVVLIATFVGININYHICGDSGIETVKIFQKPDCACETNNIQTLSDNTENHDCCGNIEEINYPTHQKIQELDCCIDYSKFINLDDIFIGNTFNFDQNFIAKIDFNSNLIKSDNKEVLEHKNKLSREFFPDLPIRKTIISIYHNSIPGDPDKIV